MSASTFIRVMVEIVVTVLFLGGITAMVVPAVERARVGNEIQPELEKIRFAIARENISNYNEIRWPCLVPWTNSAGTIFQCKVTTIRDGVHDVEIFLYNNGDSVPKWVTRQRVGDPTTANQINLSRYRSSTPKD